MQITHEQAQRLIQFDIDRALNTQDQLTLSTHLRDCRQCRAYAEELKELEGMLVPVMKRQWDLRPLPLSLDAVGAKSKSKTPIGIILTTRTAAIAVVFMMFIFSAWQFALSSRQAFSPLPVSVPPIPTPSTYSTSTTITSQACKGRIHAVQENDTLESIAYQFAVSEQEIMAANNLKTETLHTAMELIIPTCNLTPTGTINPKTLTRTFTPAIHSTTSTPDG